MPLSKKDCQAMHEAYVTLTQIFLQGWINQGATWAQCQEAIAFGDDEKDEDVVNPLFPEVNEQGDGDEPIREDHHQAPEPPEDAPYCDMCGGRHEQGHCHDLQ